MKSIITSLTAVAIISTFMFSCTEKNTKSVYICPMKCQQDTVYQTKGNCPICGMELDATTEYDSTKTTIINNIK